VIKILSQKFQVLIIYRRRKKIKIKRIKILILILGLEFFLSFNVPKVQKIGFSDYRIQWKKMKKEHKIKRISILKGIN